MTEPYDLVAPAVVEALLDPDPSEDRRFLFGNVRVLRVVDGDTVDVLIVWSVGFRMGMFSEQRLRLLGIDAPETNRSAEREAGLEAQARVEELLPIGSRVAIETHKADAFGRYLADVHLESGAVVTAAWVDPPTAATLSETMVDEGHATVWRRR